MNNHFLYINKYKIWIIAIIYLSFSLIGLYILQDFGLSTDEWIVRYEGFINLKYIFSILSPDKIIEINEILKPIDSSENLIIEKYGSTEKLLPYGMIFNLLAAYIEHYFNIVDSRDYYLFRHYLNYSIFLISNFYFFLIVKERFNSVFWGIMGAFFLFLSPRIFAQSFYNHKDLLFLSIFIINLYYGLVFLRSSKLKNSSLFALTSALAIDVRIMGIFLPLLIIFFCYLKYLRNNKNNISPSLYLYLILTPLLTVFFWPYLWENPIINFINAFKSFSIYSWHGYNLYLGTYISPTNLPWHYIFVWIVITTPLLYLVLLIFGLSNFILRLKSRLFKINEKHDLNDLWRGEKELQDLIFNTCFFVPIFLVILFNSSLYDGWRHLYFIYPCLLLISLKGLYLIKIKFFRKNFFAFLFLITLFLIQISYTMISNHPHQNVYFNFLAGKNIERNFELDYWGLSNKQAFEYILNNDDKKKILIGSASTNHLSNSKKILARNDRRRILITENISADYIIDNYRNWHGRPKKEFVIPYDFEIYKEILVGKQKIISIYKRI